MTTTENTITATRDEIADLAHHYHLYYDALVRGNDVGISIYGGWLLSSQQTTGVELSNSFTVRVAIAAADERIAAAHADADELFDAADGFADDEIVLFRGEHITAGLLREKADALIDAF